MYGRSPFLRSSSPASAFGSVYKLENEIRAVLKPTGLVPTELELQSRTLSETLQNVTFWPQDSLTFE